MLLPAWIAINVTFTSAYEISKSIPEAAIWSLTGYIPLCHEFAHIIAICGFGISIAIIYLIVIAIIL
jgi:hypothetical protein